MVWTHTSKHKACNKEFAMFNRQFSNKNQTNICLTIPISSATQKGKMRSMVHLDNNYVHSECLAHWDGCHTTEDRSAHKGSLLAVQLHLQRKHYQILWSGYEFGFINDLSTSVRVMTWCRQATSHYPHQCWHKYLSPFGITVLQFNDWISFMLANNSVVMFSFINYY